jgi:hypothetical protein
MEDQAIKDELKQMDDRLTEMEGKMTSIDTKLTQVVDAILGNPLTKSGGFIHDIETMEKKRDAMEKRISALEEKQGKFDEFRKRLIWTIGILVSLAAIVEYFVRLYKVAGK